ncbi:LPS export ABC transporter permease LptF [Uliginosibacterium gangwonense]|uniref:LPS export ABC transporter permease LptF n=1 Tax=Uliginosibacterium gangwonense TaxID=392736 RepID=UPI0003783B37|nr:LPS export ABC transporter permease LptF [Uliginosibacterium gangwonense]
MIFQRAALREFASNAAAVFVALFFILVTFILVRLLSQAAGGRVPADAVLALIGFSSLNHLPVVLALSVFVAVLTSITRSYRDSEMVVWFSSGLSLRAWISPVLRFTLPVALVIAVLSLFLSPWAQGRAGEYRKRLENREEVSRVAPGMFRESTNSQRVFFVEAVDKDAGRVKNVFISNTKDGRQGVVVSSEGLLETAKNGDRFVVLLNGHRYEGMPGTADYRVMSFARYAVRMEPHDLGTPDVTPKTLSTAELLASSSLPSRGEMVWRLGIPVATLVLALLAIPLAFVNPRAGRANNMFFAILTFTIYMNLLGLCQAWVSKGKLAPALGTYGVHAVMIALLVGMFVWRMWPGWRWWRR